MAIDETKKDFPDEEKEGEIRIKKKIKLTGKVEVEDKASVRKVKDDSSPQGGGGKEGVRDGEGSGERFEEEPEQPEQEQKQAEEPEAEEPEPDEEEPEGEGDEEEEGEEGEPEDEKEDGEEPEEEDEEGEPEGEDSEQAEADEGEEIPSEEEPASEAGAGESTASAASESAEAAESAAATARSTAAAARGAAVAAEGAAAAASAFVAALPWILAVVLVIVVIAAVLGVTTLSVVAICQSDWFSAGGVAYATLYVGTYGQFASVCEKLEGLGPIVTSITGFQPSEDQLCPSTIKPDREKYPTLLVSCEDCVNLANLGIPVKPPPLTNPLANRGLANRLLPVMTANENFWVTEGFCPTANHNSPNHYNGYAVDINFKPEFNDLPREQKIPLLTKLSRDLLEAGFTRVLCEYPKDHSSEGLECGAKTTTIGGHIHAEDPNGIDWQ